MCPWMPTLEGEGRGRAHSQRRSSTGAVVQQDSGLMGSGGCFSLGLSWALSHQLSYAPHCLSVCLSICLSAVHPSVCLSASLFACLPACLPPCLPASLSTCLPPCLPACLSPRLPPYLLVCLPACLPCPPVYLLTWPSLLCPSQTSGRVTALENGSHCIPTSNFYSEAKHWHLGHCSENVAPICISTFLPGSWVKAASE